MSPRHNSPASEVLLYLWITFLVGVSVVWREVRLTCTVPGTVPGQSCAGLRAAGTGMGQETAPPQLHRDPAAQRKPPISKKLSHCHIVQRSIKGCPGYYHCEQKLMLYVAMLQNRFWKSCIRSCRMKLKQIFALPLQKSDIQKWWRHWPEHNPLGSPCLYSFIYSPRTERKLALDEDKRRGGKKR